MLVSKRIGHHPSFFEPLIIAKINPTFSIDCILNGYTNSSSPSESYTSQRCGMRQELWVSRLMSSKRARRFVS
jgi:hypothetical protein